MEYEHGEWLSQHVWFKREILDVIVRIESNQIVLLFPPHSEHILDTKLLPSPSIHPSIHKQQQRSQCSSLSLSSHPILRQPPPPPSGTKRAILTSPVAKKKNNNQAAPAPRPSFQTIESLPRSNEPDLRKRGQPPLPQKNIDTLRTASCMSGSWVRSGEMVGGGFDLPQRIQSGRNGSFLGLHLARGGGKRGNVKNEGEVGGLGNVWVEVEKGMEFLLVLLVGYR